MPNHFSSIGVAGDRDGVMSAVVRVASRTAGIDGSDGARVHLAVDDSDAAIAVTINADGQIQCAKPYLDGPALPTRVRLTGFVEDQGCLYCSVVLFEVLDDSDEMVFPLAVELPDVATRLPGLTTERVLDVQVSGIAESLELYADEAAYTATEPVFAPRSLVPSGMFTPGVPAGEDSAPPRAKAIVTGVVAAASRRHNETFGGDFWRLDLDTYGMSMPIAVDPELVELDPAVGNVCNAEVWLVARV
jgi:hypothetical protein